MSKFAESFRSHTTPGAAESQAVAELRDECPELASILGGSRNSMGGWEVPPCTVMLFVEGDRLKFCLSPQTGNRVAFGVLKDPTKGLLSLEEELVKGAYEWKARKGGR